ncbi:hypothetical protein DU292_08510 [Escherichia coli]|uniref:hypothetical protein n=1 Tax=Escherichia coli TaxID=562 RepID=UPI0003BB1669|nr:hypothetical protein [Escherichia coli]HBP1425059.1 hypothetical protein [Escherichia coli str. K-12 substr. MG1655star]EGO1326255.1 hypothetical protein [Escherichia coli]EHK7482077.1 hypothetical protein [Escherichia coli]EHL7589061.1 hypothetical protein [Escherichia coli]EHL7630156.1 hypothetical protein [Escherichia coli]
MNDIKTAYSLGSEGMLITRYTEDASFHEVEIKDYHEVLKDMEAGKYDADLNLALQIVDIVMDANIRDYVSLSAEEKTSVARYVFCLAFVKRMEEEYGRVPVPEDIDPLAFGSAVIFPLDEKRMGSIALYSMRGMMKKLFEVKVMQKCIDEGHKEEEIKFFMPLLYVEMVGNDMRANDLGVQAAIAVLNDARKNSQPMPEPEKRVLH